MENSIGNGAIKIACIQTIPGMELQVKEQLKAACEEDSEIEAHLFLKGIGKFDIILLYLTNDFGSQLRRAGHIPGILKSNILLCYPYFNKKAKTLFKLHTAKHFTSFCMLKISPGLKKYFPEIDELLRSYIATKKTWSVLGSLGWNELIILISDDELIIVIHELMALGQLLLDTGHQSLSVILKTFSFIGVNYDLIPTKEIVKKSFKATKDFLSKTKSFDKLMVGSSDSEILPSIRVSVKPFFIFKTKQYFQRKGFDCIDLIGKRDILLKPKTEMSMGHFLSSLLFFRNKFKSRIFETQTSLDFKENHKKNNGSELPAKIPPFKFDYDELEGIFGDEFASQLANLFYTLNSLFQNPLSGNVYADMSTYPKYLFSSAKDIKESGGDFINFAQGGREVIRRGAELRSYGTFETIEEVTGRFSELRGGCQLSLLAMEYLPSTILEKFDIEWMGFIITGEANLFHINEVINVPNDFLWNPQSWWALYHEIAHVIIDNSPELINPNIPSVIQFLSNKEYYGNWFDQLVEFTAEVIGFELGFFGDYDEFIKLLWNHLVKVDPFLGKSAAIENYARRTFFVKLFEGCFRRSSSVKTVSKKEFTSHAYLYKEFLIHLNEIERNLDKEIFYDRNFLAAENAVVFEESYPFASHLFGEIKKIKFPTKKSLKTKNTNQIVESLSKGKIWTKEIHSAEAVLYCLLKSTSTFTFSGRIATILTLWNQQMLRYSERFK